MGRIAIMAAALAAATLLPGATPAKAEGAGCPPVAQGQRLPWFLRIAPGDDLMTAWCRMQALPGTVKLNVLFPVTNAHRSWDTQLAGQNLPARRIVDIVQSLIPTADGPAKDKDGMSFPRILNNVVQGVAAETPDGSRPVGFPEGHPAAKELILWEPISLRVKPVALAGQEFTLSVNLRPSLGIFALAMQKRATDIRFLGWKGRMPAGGFMSGGCPDAIPACKDVPEVATFHAPWLVTSVTLTATGENMTASAAAVMNQLSASSGAFVTGSPQFDVNTGIGQLEAKDAVSRMTMKTEGGASGTKSIKIEWTATPGKGSLAQALDKALNAYRSSMPEDPNSGPSVPDSLGQL